VRVGFLQVGPAGTVHARLARQMVASVRRAMPGVSITQFAAEGSARVPDVDAMCLGSAAPLALACLEAYASCEGEWLFLDSDVIVQRDVRRVFDQVFDVAVATRVGTLLEKEIGTKFMAAMPFNKGAVFSRSRAFWVAAYARLRDMPTGDQDWMGDQRAMNAVIAGGGFHVAILANDYNYPPKRRDEDVRDKAIVHFKGPRKPWALERVA
jgi:hypothetical protein